MDLAGQVEEFISVKAKSPETVRGYRSILRRFVDSCGSGRVDEAAVNRFLLRLQAGGMVGGSLMHHRATILSFLSFCDVAVKKDRVKRFDPEPVREDRVPTQQDMGGLLFNAGVKTRVVMVLQAFGALRFKPISKLKLKHLRGLRAGADGIVVDGVPLWIHIPKVDDEGKTFDKRGAKHETFLIAEGVEYIREYLEQRLRRGERLSMESYVVADSRGRRISEKAIEMMIKRYFKRRGFRGRPYVLKKYCENRMLASGMKESYQKFFSGWKAGRELIMRYGLSVELPEEVIEEMRLEYAKAEPYLTTRPASGDMEALRTEIERKEEEQRMERRALLERIKALEREKEEDKRKDDELYQKIMAEMKKTLEEARGVREEAERVVPKKERGSGGGNPGPVQRVVDVEELPNHLSHGWRAVLTLPNGKIVIEKT